MKFLAKLLPFIGCLLFIVILVSTFINALTLFNSTLSIVTTAGFTLGIAGFVSYLAIRYLSQKMFLISLILVGILLRVGWIVWIQTPPASDFLYLHTAAVSAATGDFSFSNSEYFASWVYQLGFTMYEALIIKLFGSSLLALKLMNVLFSVGTAVIIYSSGAKIFNEPSGRIASLISILYVPNILMCSVLTNQHLSTFLFMLGCFLLIQDWNSKYRWIYVGLLFGLGNIIRPIGSVFLIGLVLFILFIQLRSYSKPQIWRALTKVAGVIVIFYLVQSLVSYSFIAGGVTQYPLSNREPYWKFMVGFNASSNGAWSMEDAKYVQQYKLGEERNRAELAVVRDRLDNLPAITALMTRKLVLLWGSADASTLWSLQELNKPDLSVLLNKIERVMYLLMSFFAALSLFALYRMKQPHMAYLYVLLILLYAGVHLIIEIQTRYRLDLMPAFILLQSYGVYKVYMLLQNLAIVRPKDRGAEM